MDKKKNISKKILILGASEVQLSIILHAKELGHTILIADYDPHAIGFQFADIKFNISTNDILELIDVAKKHDIDGVLTTSDYPVRSVAAICKELHLTGLSVESSILCTNKYLLRKHLKKNNFKVPRYSIIDSENALNNIDFFPCIIKPIDSSGSRGVQKVFDKTELQFAYELALNYSKSGNIIVEEFIDGKEYSIESLTQKNQTTIVAITEKTVIGDKDRFFVEDRHIIPANIDQDVFNAVCITVQNVLSSINLDNSSTHTELKINDKGIYIIEIGARLGGDYITSDLVPLSTGVNMLDNTIRLALNEKINTQHTITKFAGIQFLNSSNYKHIEQYLRKNNASIIRKEIKTYKDSPLRNSFDRLGYFIAQSNSRDELINILNCK